LKLTVLADDLAVQYSLSGNKGVFRKLNTMFWILWIC